MPNELQLLIIGLDGATFDVIRPMIASGELPNLTALMNNGSSGFLESTVPPFSPPAWTSFMTGFNPGRHGIFGFVNFDPLSYAHLDSRPVTARSLAGHTFFDILGNAGYRLAVITVPITFPAWAINGYMVAGEPCPDTETGLAYPTSLAAELPDRYAFLSTFWSKPNDEIIAGLVEMDDRRTALALQLMEEKELDVMVLVLGATDRAQHNFWRYYDPSFGAKLNLPREADYDDVIPDIYRRADKSIGRLVARMGKDTAVFIISDHGGGPAAMHYLHTNAWLQQQGLLSVSQSRDSMVSGLRRVVIAARRSLGTEVEHRLRGLLPNRAIEQGRALVRNVAQIDWSLTRAYRFPMYPPAEGIVINVAGRQPQGIVQSGGEYEQLREQILKQARQLINPATGQPVVVRAYKREELYDGPHTARAPDLVLILAEDYRGSANVHPPVITAVAPSMYSKVNGEHRMHGILMAGGPMIGQDNWVENARLVDMAPTILYTLGLPVPEEMDGIVLVDLFSPQYLDTHPIQYSQQGAVGTIGSADTGLALEEEEQIRRQLDRLGYL
jgi:predicted AlkP superfamily phosphohydrolase/phosphomutase